MPRNDSLSADGVSPVTLKDAGREHICGTLEETKGVVAGPRGAATRLGMKRSTLYFRMRKLASRSHKECCRKCEERKKRRAGGLTDEQRTIDSRR